MVGGAPGGATTSTGGWMRARMPEDSGACTGAVAARWGGVGADRRRQLLQPRFGGCGCTGAAMQPALDGAYKTCGPHGGPSCGAVGKSSLQSAFVKY